MGKKLTMKEINTWRQELQEIAQMNKGQDDLVPKSQKERLRKLAQEAGASTRSIGCHEDGKPFGYDASISELINNINQAIQTATSIVNGRYTRRSVYVAVGAVIVAVFTSLASCYFSNKAISTAQQANEMTHDSLELQTKEFGLRNRPYLTIYNYKLSDTETSDPHGKKWPCHVEFKLKNISEIPANNIKVSSEVYLNGESVRKGDFLPVALSKGVSKTTTIGLPGHIYSDAKDEKNKIVIKIDITYFGILDKNIEHGISEVVYYSPIENAFKILKQEYK